MAPPTRRPGGVRSLLRGGAGMTIAILVMNVSTYGFQIVAARTLGPADYGVVASLMALLLVVAVVQLGLQATAARRIAAEPDAVGRIAPAMLRLTYRAALALGVLLLVAAPLVWHLLRLESIVPALLVAATAVPLTVVGGQAGILQGERRWLGLGLIYVAMGVPRVVLGTGFVLVRPDEIAAMLGVALGAVVPVAAGWWMLRHDVHHVEWPSESLRVKARESTRNSFVLLAFFGLTNVDIVVARNVLDPHEAGLYAGGLILTKAVLFLPQAVVVVAFPAMSTVEERRRTLVRSLLVVFGIGVACSAGSVLLSDLTMIFIGGEEYAEVQDLLWLFAILGTLLAMLQLLVYAVLARQGSHAAPLMWVAAVALVGVGVTVSGVGALATVAAMVDGALFLVLLGVGLWRLREPQPTGSVGGLVPAEPGPDRHVERDC